MRFAKKIHLKIGVLFYNGSTNIICRHYYFFKLSGSLDFKVVTYLQRAPFPASITTSKFSKSVRENDI